MKRYYIEIESFFNYKIIDNETKKVVYGCLFWLECKHYVETELKGMLIPHPKNPKENYWKE